MKARTVCLTGMTAVAAAFAAGLADAPLTNKVPYRLTAAKHFLIRAKVNGQGPFNLIVDTGAPALVLASKLAEPLGVTAVNGWATLDRFEIEGGVKLERVTARLDDLFQLEGMNGMGLAGVEIHGLVGYPILSRFCIEYDLTKPKLTWTAVNYRPDELPRGRSRGAAGGLDALGAVMKTVGRLFGMSKLPPEKPRGYLGLGVTERGDQLIVASVVPGGPADSAGVRAGDAITSVEGKAVATADNLRAALAGFGAEERVSIGLRRGEDLTVMVTTGGGF